MFIEIEGTYYELVGTSEAGIRIARTGAQKKTIYAQPGISMDEIKAYIRQFAKEQVADPTEDEERLSFFTLELFDKKYNVRLLPDSHQKPFIKKELILAGANLFRRRERSKIEDDIRSQLFEQTILDLVGSWEEELGILVDQVSFRKLSRSHYTMQQDPKQLTFSKHNVLLSRRLNEYIVAMAMTDLVDPTLQTSTFWNSHFPDWRQLEKYLNYGS